MFKSVNWNWSIVFAANLLLNYIKTTALGVYRTSPTFSLNLYEMYQSTNSDLQTFFQTRAAWVFISFHSLSATGLRGNHMPTVCTQYTRIHRTPSLGPDLSARISYSTSRSEDSVQFSLTLLAMLTVDRLKQMESSANEAMPTVLALYGLQKSTSNDWAVVNAFSSLNVESSMCLFCYQCNLGNASSGNPPTVSQDSYVWM